LNVPLLVLDVDGVMTDGTKIYGDGGKVIGKRFCDLDFTAIKKFKERGWEVCWMSADKEINAKIAETRGIDFVYSRDDQNQINKHHLINGLCEKYMVKMHQVVYVGDDLFDVAVMRVVMEGGGKIYCPTNAAPYVKRLAHVLCCGGGAGAVMVLFDSLCEDDGSQPWE
jgi:3-deoxy-D-manno-octulosonate 8-phosphate phosphatase (KDO 8-P phosphatase)